MMGGFGMGGMGLGWLFWLILLAVVVLLAWRAVGNQQGKHKSSRQEDSAPEILKKRYAKGELSTEEYREKRKELENDN